MKRLLIVAALVLLATPAWADTEPVEVVNYDIQVRLDPVHHTLQGTESVRWTNTTSAPTDELWWHLYLNAFASNRTTFMRELGPRYLRGGPLPEMHWGWTRITSMSLDDGTDLLPEMAFERPDDGNPDDYTVARVKLPEAVPPGGSVVLHLAFEAQLPKVIARSGWSGEFHLVGQWFPKLGVYEDAGVRGRSTPGWNCHQYHANSEFYADFGSFTVTVTVPDHWVVGASGVEQSRRQIESGTSRETQITYRADRVHDFAWTAAPAALMDVVEAEFDPGRDVPAPWLAEASGLLGLSPAELELPPVKLRLLIPHSQRFLADRTLLSARLGIAWYGLHYGPYPYPQLTIVDPPITAGEAGGMEYPTFITTGGSRWLRYPPAKWVPLVEMVTIHEFGHQYFYGLIASNEFEEAWLDEGFNSFAEASCSAAAMRDHLFPDVPWYDPWTGDRIPFLFRTIPVKVDRFAWAFRTRGDYSTASYSKTAVVLKTLQGLVGPQAFARAMRTYAERYRYRHPDGDDFISTFNESVGADYSWFFDQALRGQQFADFAVLRVRQQKVGEQKGYEWHDGAWEKIAKAEEAEPTPAASSGPPAKSGPGDKAAAGEGGHQGEKTSWKVTVDIGRRGGLEGPVDVELVWDDGTREQRTWDGRERWVEWAWNAQHRLERVIVDPKGVWAMEAHRENNYWAAKAAASEGLRRLWWVDDALALVGLTALPWS
ncbi:MAG: M1 family metallopeptidase [Acidobacteria bacterium]|nr:M1 family metallopeptidase [Acidobacteriota bacterium]